MPIQEQRTNLHAAVELAKQQLEEARDRWRCLRNDRITLQNRLSATLHDTTHQPRVTPIRHESPDFAAPSGLNDALTARQLALDNLQSLSYQLVPKPVARTHFPAGFSPLSAHHSNPNPQGASGQATRPIDSYVSSESISLAAISPFLSPGRDSTRKRKYNAVSQAVAAYQHSVSTRTGVPLPDICWIVQWSFPETGPALSFTASASSPECVLCASTCFFLSGLESLFLVFEHETLLQASDELCEPPEHPSLDASAPPPTLPTPPNPAVLERAFVRCGLNQMMPLKVALERALRPLLTQYRARLPLCHWRAACIQCMHITQAVVEGMSARLSASKPSEADSGSADNMHSGAQCGHWGTGAAEPSTQQASITATEKHRCLHFMSFYSFSGIKTVCSYVW